MAMRPCFDGYAICATSRSGSTLLCRALTQTGLAGCPDSYMHLPSVEAWAKAVGVPGAIDPDNRADLATVLAAIKSKGCGETPVFGLRIMHKSFDYAMSRLRLLHPTLTSDRARIEASFGRLLYIHLGRTDKLAQAVSMVRAEQTGLWHVKSDGSELERTAPPATPRYDRNAIAAHLAKFEADDAAWTRWFSQHDIVPLTLSYEALARDPQGVVRDILSALYGPMETQAEVTVDVAKLADDISADWAKRFRREQRADRPRSGDNQ